MKPSTLIHKLLKRQKYAKIKEIKRFLAKFKIRLNDREIKQEVHVMRETGFHIGTDYRKGWHLVETLKEHERTVAFWDQRKSEALYMKSLAEKNWARKTAKLI